MATAVSPGPAGNCHNFRTGCSTGSIGSGSDNTAATAERTAKAITVNASNSAMTQKAHDEVTV